MVPMTPMAPGLAPPPPAAPVVPPLPPPAAPLVALPPPPEALPAQPLVQLPPLPEISHLGPEEIGDGGLISTIVGDFNGYNGYIYILSGCSWIWILMDINTY